MPDSLNPITPQMLNRLKTAYIAANEAYNLKLLEGQQLGYSIQNRIAYAKEEREARDTAFQKFAATLLM